MENQANLAETDLQALLASINSNFEEGLSAKNLENPEKTADFSEKSPEKRNIFTVVREKPEEIAETDPLLNTLERIKPVNLKNSGFSQDFQKKGE